MTNRRYSANAALLLLSVVLILTFNPTYPFIVPKSRLSSSPVASHVHSRLDDDNEVADSSVFFTMNGFPSSSMPDEAFLNNDNIINGYSMPKDKNVPYSAFLEGRNKPRWMRRALLKTKKVRSKLPSLSSSDFGNGNDDKEMEEDGYGEMQRRRRSFVKKVLRRGYKSARRIIKREQPIQEPGTLILVRHGESEWNANKTFTGWADPDLTENGTREVEHAARLLMEGGYRIDVVFTSRLKRAIRSVWIILREFESVYLPVSKSWRLNERMYGALTGLSKKETAEELGHDLVQEWRGSLRSRPPALDTSNKYWPGRDRKYADLSSEELPVTESLMDCMERTFPLWERKIKWELQRGRNVLLCAHANTLRGMVKIIDDIGDDEIQGK